MADLGSEVDPTTERTRRRFARRQWRRRWLQLKPILATLAAVTVVGLAVWLVWFSAVLGVSKVEVTGTSALSPAEVRAAAVIDDGTPLARIDLRKIQDRVGVLAPVASVQATRQWPRQITISVTEREPIAVIEIGGKMRGLDKEGVVFLNYKTAPKGLPKVVTPEGTEARALREAAQVVSSLPKALASITRHVRVVTIDEITLVLTKGRTVAWGSSVDSTQKAQVLTALLPTRAKVYDVSVPGQPTTR